MSSFLSLRIGKESFYNGCVNSIQLFSIRSLVCLPSVDFKKGSQPSSFSKDHETLQLKQSVYSTPPVHTL